MRNRPALIAILLMAALQIAVFPGHWFGAEGDEALYVLLSRSLLHGRYGLEVIPGDPVYNQVTPGWPMLLAPVGAVWGDSPFAYQAWALLWLAACDFLVFFWSRRRVGTRAALAATALFALNPLVLSRAGVVMPELPGLALTLGVLLLVERPKTAPGALLGALLGLCYLIRPALLPLVPACGAALWSRGRRREAAWGVGVAVATWAAWRLWARSGGGFSDAGEAAAALSGAGWGGWPEAALFNARQSVTLWGRTLTPSGGPDSVGLAIGAVLALPACFGLARRLGRRPQDAATLFLVGSLLMHAVWPWWYERYLPPLLPFILLAVWDGAQRLGVPGRPAAWGAALLALIPLPFQGLVLARGVGGSHDQPPLETYAFLRNLPQDGLVASVFFPRDAWYSGRPCVPLPAGPVEPEVLARRRVRWVLWEEGGDYGSSLGEKFPAARGRLAWSLRLAGGGYRLVHRPDEGGRAVYEIKVTPGRP